MKILPPEGLSVDQLIAALQAISHEGLGSAPVHVLVGGTTTGTVRSVEPIHGWHTAIEVAAVLMADNDSDEAAQGHPPSASAP